MGLRIRGIDRLRDDRKTAEVSWKRRMPRTTLYPIEAEVASCEGILAGLPSGAECSRVDTPGMAALEAVSVGSLQGVAVRDHLG